MFRGTAATQIMIYVYAQDQTVKKEFALCLFMHIVHLPPLSD